MSFVSGRTWVVNVSSVHASDANPGTAAQPFKTLAPAAAAAQPGDTVLVGAGVYRERVAPARGGLPGAPIVYMAALGETVVLRASEQLTWHKGTNLTFTTPLTDSLFESLDGNKSSPLYNPYRDSLQPGQGCSAYTTGQVYADGTALIELPPGTDVTGCMVPYWIGRKLKHYHTPDGCFSALKNGTVLSASWPDRYNGSMPSSIEVTVRSRVFAPHIRGLAHIHVQGFIMEYAANQWVANFWYPQNFHYAQSGVLGTRSGYMWTIRNNTIRYGKTIGLDIGIEGGYRPAGGGDNEGTNQPIPNITGNHTVVNNIIEDNGASGIQGYVASGTLSYNVVQGNGALKCAGAENAAIKTHGFRGMFEGNVIRRNPNLMPIWFDSNWGGMRMTRNVIITQGNASLNGVMFELSDGPALVDNNLFVGGDMPSWHGHWSPSNSGRPGGTGIFAMDASNIEFSHNLITDFTGGPAIDLHGLSGRSAGGHTAALSGWRITGNTFFSGQLCPFLNMHNEKQASDRGELVCNETVVHNLQISEGFFAPNATNLDIVIQDNPNATGALNVIVDRDAMTLSVAAPGTVVGTSGCASNAPGADMDFTGKKRSSSSGSCVAGPLADLANGKTVSVSMWPAVRNA